MTVTLEAAANRSHGRAHANPALVAALAITAVAAATLAGAWFFSAGAGYPSLSALPRAALRLLSGDSRSARWWRCGGQGCSRGALVRGLRILAAAALGNAWLGAYHAGVEWHFWQGPTDCTGEIGNLGSAGNLLQRLDTVNGDPLRRSAVALSRPVAGRLQRADLAADGRDRRVGHRHHVQALNLWGGGRDLVVDIFLRASEQMDDARRRDGDKDKTRQVMRADEKRIDVQPSAPAPAWASIAPGANADNDVGRTAHGCQRNHRDECSGNGDRDGERSQRRH